MTIKSKLKTVLFAAMLAGATMTAQSAYAGNPYASIEVDEDGFSGSFSHTFSKDSQGAFEDLYSFVVDQGFTSSASITSSFTTVGTKISDLTITGFNLLQIDPVTLAVLNTVTGVNNTASGATATDKWSITTDALVAGTYYIQVLGTVNGAAAVTYSGDISGLAAAVPEPETYGMMLGGLGLLGFVARRKKAAQKAA